MTIKKVFLLELALYHEQHYEQALLDPTDFSSPLIDVLLYEKDNTVTQSIVWMEYLNTTGIAWKNIPCWIHPNPEQLLVPLRSWLHGDISDGVLDSNNPFPFALARFAVLADNCETYSFFDRAYIRLDDLKNDPLITVNSF